MSKPLTILFDATPLCRKTDGVGRYAHELLIQLANSSSNQKIILIGFIGDKLTAPDVLNLPHVSFVKLPIVRKIYSFLYFRFIRIPLDMFMPSFDVLISTNFTRFPFVTKRPTLVAIHDLAFLRFPETIERKNLSHLRKQVPRALSENKAVIATSEFTKRELEEVFPNQAKVFTVGIGIDTTIWKPSSIKRKEYILAVGTIEPRKNLNNLLLAYNLLSPELQKAHPLLVVGKIGWGSVDAQPNKNVSFTGYVDDEKLLDLYRQAKLFVSPSIYEGFGLPLLEALSTNTPVACADIPPYRDTAGTQASYFNPNSIEDIAKVLSKVLSKKSITGSFNADAYSWKKSIQTLSSAIEYVLRK